MRMLLPALLLPLLLLVMSTPALAGLRATYVDGEKKIVIEVADNGDARITPEGSAQHGILRGGELYVVGVENGVPKVARVTDIAAALDQVMPPVFKALFTAAAKKAERPGLRIEPRGRKQVGGREGLAYAVWGMDDTKTDAPLEIVVSTDPALKPVGKALDEFMVGTTVLLGGFLGPAAAEMAQDMRAVFALGTPLDGGGKLRLSSLETVTVPPEATRLPAEPEPLAALLAEMKKGMAMTAPDAQPEPAEARGEPEEAQPTESETPGLEN